MYCFFLFNFCDFLDRPLFLGLPYVVSVRCAWVGVYIYVYIIRSKGRDVLVVILQAVGC